MLLPVLDISLMMKKTNEYLEGVPLQALKVQPPFDYYWFVELDNKKVEELNKLKEHHADKDIKILNADANYVLKWEIIPFILELNKSCGPQRGIIILDPYGLQIDWTTVEEIAKAGIFDVVINFSIMGVIRNLPRSAEFVKREKLQRIMGTA